MISSLIKRELERMVSDSLLQTFPMDPARFLQIQSSAKNYFCWFEDTHNTREKKLSKKTTIIFLYQFFIDDDDDDDFPTNTDE